MDVFPESLGYWLPPRSGPTPRTMTSALMRVRRALSTVYCSLSEFVLEEHLGVTRRLLPNLLQYFQYAMMVIVLRAR
jgi:hypothetical protein